MTTPLKFPLRIGDHASTEDNIYDAAGDLVGECYNHNGGAKQIVDAVNMPRGLTESQATRLQAYIRRHVEMQVAESWKGAGDPADWPALEAEAARRKKRLNNYINHLKGQP